MSSEEVEKNKTCDGTTSRGIPSEKSDGRVDISGLSAPDGIEDEMTRDSSTGEEIIITGKDASEHLLPRRDDHDPALTFRSVILATALSCFAAVMAQIYNFKPTYVSISGTFIVLLAYFLGNAWATCLPRGDHQEALWREKGGEAKPPTWIRLLLFVNPSTWGLKEHAICAITATSASNTADIIQVFAAQDLFYDLSLNGTTVILAIISVTLFGYGIAGLIRPFAVWDVDAVYWGTLPIVKTLQALHWQNVKSSKPLRFFWYAYGSMFAYGRNSAHSLVFSMRESNPLLSLDYPMAIILCSLGTILDSTDNMVSRMVPCLYFSVAKLSLNSLSRRKECYGIKSRSAYQPVWWFCK